MGELIRGGFGRKKVPIDDVVRDERILTHLKSQFAEGSKFFLEFIRDN